jgi:hypothetical protein
MGWVVCDDDALLSIKESGRSGTDRAPPLSLSLAPSLRPSCLLNRASPHPALPRHGIQWSSIQAALSRAATYKTQPCTHPVRSHAKSDVSGARFSPCPAVKHFKNTTKAHTHTHTPLKSRVNGATVQTRPIYETVGTLARATVRPRLKATKTIRIFTQ